MNSIDMRFGATVGMGNIAVDNLALEPRLRGNGRRNWSGELSGEGRAELTLRY